MKIFGFFFALSLSSLVYSSELIVSNSIEVLAISGIKTTSTFFGEEKIEVDNGSHQIVVKYNHKFRNDEILESKPYIFTIEIEGDTKLTTDRFTTYAQAKKSIKKDIAWHVENQQRKYTIEGADKLKGKGFMPYRNIELLVQEYNQLNNINSTAPIDQEVFNNKASKNYLIEQYKAATQEQKNQFKMWLIQH